MADVTTTYDLATTAITELTGRLPQHPLQIVARAYGIPVEQTR